jgi:Cytochrome c3
VRGLVSGTCDGSRNDTFCPALPSKRCALAPSLATGVVLPAQAAPARHPKAAAGDCLACHRGETVLPNKHRATKGQKLEACEKYHERGTETALAGKVPGSHLHQLAASAACNVHGNVKKPTEVPHEWCMACHDTTRLAEKTANVKPKNPHNSTHYGKDADCNLRHHQHAKSENYCAQCHEKWELKVP